MASRLMFLARGGALAAGLSLLAATATPVCAQKLVALQLDPRDNAGLPFEPGNQQQIDALIQKIKEAKKMDDRGASDYGMDPVDRSGFRRPREESEPGNSRSVGWSASVSRRD